MWTLTVIGCAPVLEDDTFLVTTPRVLAVSSEPAEVDPGDEVVFDALYADATGGLSDAPLGWGLCTARKPLAELGPVNESCLDPGSPDLLLLGTGRSVSGSVPADTCSLFGPNPPPPEQGEPAGRPVDADVTGGYYQPAVVFLDGDVETLASERVRCGLGGVTQETYVAWNLGYHSNENPHVASFEADGQGVPEDGAGPPPVVEAGSTVQLTAAWTACPEPPVCGDGICSAGEDVVSCEPDCSVPVGCEGAETYLVYDSASRSLITRHEAMSATWFVTAGQLDVARNGRAGDDVSTTVTNGWEVPEEPGSVWLGVVLRDERGGVGFAGYRVEVQ